MEYVEAALLMIAIVFPVTRRYKLCVKSFHDLFACLIYVILKPFIFKFCDACFVGTLMLILLDL